MTRDNISVIRLKDILLVTVPPEPDDETVSAFQEKVLDVMASNEPRGLVLDISTVQTLDSFFARTLMETVQMAALMGTPTVIAGMRPDVAITATLLGLSFGKTLTARDMDSAFDLIVEKTAEDLSR